jgi:hypothetical protein
METRAGQEGIGRLNRPSHQWTFLVDKDGLNLIGQVDDESVQYRVPWDQVPFWYCNADL